MTTIFRPMNSAESNLYIIRASFKNHTSGSGDLVLTESTTYLEAPTSNNLPSDFIVTWDDSENNYIIRYGKTFTSTPNVYVNYKTTSTTYNNDDEFDEVLFPNVYYKDITSTTNAYVTFRKMFSATNTADAGDKTCAINGFDLLIIGPVKLGQTTGQSNRGWSLGTDGSDTYTYLNVGVGTGNPQRSFHSNVHDSTANNISYPLRLTHTTSGTPANNIGTGIEFEAETSSCNNEIVAKIDAVVEDVTSTSEDSYISLKTMTGGSAASEVAKFGGSGINLGTDISGLAISIGHTTSEVIINDNLTINGNLIVSGTFGDKESFTSDLTVYDDQNNANTYISVGTSASEAFYVQVLNGSSNKTAEEVKFISKTASSTANHGKFTFSVDETDRLEINDTSLIQKYDSSNYVTHSVSSAGVYSLATTDSSSNSGAITLDTVLDIKLDSATSANGLVYSSDGTDLLRIHNSSNDVIFKPLVDSKDLIFQQYDGNEVIRIADDRRLYFFDKGGEYIIGDGSDLTLASGRDIFLNATTAINVPSNILITFANDNQFVKGDSNDLTVGASRDIILNADGGDIFLKDNTTTFGSLTNNSGNLIIKSGTTTALTMSGANIQIAGNLQVDGTTTTINSTITTLDDPIITLGGDTSPGSDDNKDRGVEFRWHNGTSAKVGFFGYDDSQSLFTFVPDATNSSEVFSGTIGDALFNKIYISDKGDEHITGDGTNFTISSGGDINLTASGDVNLPANIGLTFGSDAEKIEGDGTDLSISGNIINLNPTDKVNISGNLTIADGTNDLDVASHDGTNGLKLGGTLVTSTATELNILDGVTATSTELNYLDITTLGTSANSKALTQGSDGNVNIAGNLIIVDGTNDLDVASHDGTNGLKLGGTLVTATAAELNILDGVTATATELNILDGVTATAAELNILDGVTATAAELNILDGVTATADELNILDGVTATADELNILDGVTATAAELNILDGVTATTAELNILDGVTTTANELNVLAGVTAGTATESKALVLDASKNIGTIGSITSSSTIQATGFKDTNGTQVVGTQQSSEADLSAITSSNQGSDFSNLTDVTTEYNKAQADISALTTKVNNLLAIIRTHGLIAT